MIAAATRVRATGSRQALRALLLRLRRYRAVPLSAEQLILQVPRVGRVLVTEDSTGIRLDVVAGDEGVLQMLTTAMDAAITAEDGRNDLAHAWTRSEFVPVPLR